MLESTPHAGSLMSGFESGRHGSLPTVTEAKERRRVVVHGRVQGVAFATPPPAGVQPRRGGMGDESPRRRRRGGVRGDPDDVRSLVEFAREGPRAADVDRVDETDKDPGSRFRRPVAHFHTRKPAVHRPAVASAA